jgi:hypothetical protein
LADSNVDGQVHQCCLDFLQGVAADLLMTNVAQDNNTFAVQLKSLNNPLTKTLGTVNNLVLFLENFYCLT